MGGGKDGVALNMNHTPKTSFMEEDGIQQDITKNITEEEMNTILSIGKILGKKYSKQDTKVSLMIYTVNGIYLNMTIEKDN